jgi:hypothetical protein
MSDEERLEGCMRTAVTEIKRGIERNVRYVKENYEYVSCVTMLQYYTYFSS